MSAVFTVNMRELRSAENLLAITLVFSGKPCKVLPVGWLKTTETCSLTVLGRKLKIKVLSGLSMFGRLLGKGPSWTLWSLPLSSWDCVTLCVPASSCKDTLLGFGASPIQQALALITSAETVFPNKVMFQGSGWTWIWGGGRHYLTSIAFHFKN